MDIAHRPECSHAGTDVRHDAYAPCDTLGTGIGIYFARLAEAENVQPTDRMRDALGTVERDARAAHRDIDIAREAAYRLRDAAIQRYPQGREAAIEELAWALDRLGQTLDYIEGDASAAREVSA